MSPEADRMSTQILGMAKDDGHRTRLLVGLAGNDPDFQEQWQLQRDEIQADINLHYRNPREAARSIGVVGYMDLSARQNNQGPIAERFTRTEKFLRRLMEPAVRSAISSGLIEK